MADATSRRHGSEHGLPIWTQRCEGGVEVERRDITRVAIFVARECVDGVRNAVRERLRGLEGRVGQEGGVVGYLCGEIGRTKRLCW